MKKLSIINSIKVALFSICIGWIDSQVRAGTDPQIVYSPFSLKEYNLRNQGGSSAKIVYSLDANLVFVAAGKSGVIVIDANNFEILKTIDLNGQVITGLAATSDGRFLFMGYQNKFSVFEFKNMSLKLISQQSFYNGVIMDVTLDYTETVAFGFGMPGQICAYSVIDKNNIVLMTKYNTLSNRVRQLYITLDNKYLFLADSSSGLNILKIDNLDGGYSLKSIADGTPGWDVMDVTFTNDYQVAYLADFFYGLFVIDLKFVFDADPSLYPITLVGHYKFYWPFLTFSVSSLAISQDNKFLFVGQRARGIRIVDITSKLNPIYYQDIPSIGHSFTILLVNNDKTIFFANSISVLIFGQSAPNLNTEFPNLYNGFQSITYSPSITRYYWKCTLGKNNKYFYGMFDDDGAYIMSYDNDPYNMKVLSKIQNIISTQIDFLWFNDDETILIIGASTNQDSLQVYDITDKTNPILLQEVTKSPSNDTDGCVFTQDMKRLICANGGDGIFITDTSVITNIKIIFTWSLESFMTGTVKDVVIKDNKYIICAIRNYGICLLELTNTDTLELRNYYKSNGGEGVLLSLDKKYVFIKDGINGITIMNIMNLPDWKIQGQVQLEGWNGGAISLQKDNYLVGVTTEAGYITLVNIKDKSNPFIVSKYNPGKENSYNGCVDSFENYFFVVNDKGIRVIPIKTTLYIHTEIVEVTGEDQGKRMTTSINKSQKLQVIQSFISHWLLVDGLLFCIKHVFLSLQCLFIEKVGQIVEFNFLILYPERNIKINDILYLVNYEIKQLPYWITYTSSTQNLRMQIVKEALSSGSVKESLNTIIVQTLKQIYQTDFIYNDPEATTNESQSISIFKYLKQMQYINNDNYLTFQFDPESLFEFTINGVTSSPRLFTLVKLTLTRTRYQNPVIFYIESSLKVDFQSNKDYIVSESNQIKIYLRIKTQIAKFVSLDYPGVITSTTDKLDEIKLEGSKENINRALNQGIYISKLDIDSQIDITVIVQDGTNYDFETVIQASQASFIKFQSQILVGDDFQAQILKWFPSSIADIAADLSFEFSESSFIAPKTVKLVYTALLLQGNEYKPLPSDFWLQFAKTSIKFYGKAKTSEYRSTFTFRVNATDGYTYAYQDFYIKMNGLPFVFVFNLLVQVFGPLIAVLGVFQYKYQIFNLIFKKKTTYSAEIALVNKNFIKTFTIIGNDLQKAKLIFEQFKKITLNISNSNNLPSKDDQIQKKFMKIQTQESIKAIEEFQDEKLSPLKRPYYQPKIRRQKLIRNPNIDTKQFMQIIHTKNNMIVPNVFQRVYLNDDGTIKNGKIFRECVSMDIQYKLNGKVFSVKEDIRQFKDINSRFYISFKSIASRFFLSIDEKSQAVYNYMKLYAMNKFAYTHNDWYKAYIEVQHCKRENENQQLQPFPKLTLKEDMIKEVFMDLNIMNDKNQYLRSVRNFRINYPLIKNVLFADCYGLVDYSPSFLSPCVGESIHLEYHEIDSVQAFQLIKQSFFLKLRKFFGLEYVKLCLQKNKSIPNWMNFDMRNGIIILEGMPGIHDVDDLLIRVYDENQYIIQQFNLKIADEYNPKDEDLENIEEQKDYDQFQSIIEDTMFKSNQVAHEFADDKKQHQDSQFKISHKLMNSSYQSTINLKQVVDFTPRKIEEENEGKFISVQNIVEGLTGTCRGENITGRIEDITTTRQEDQNLRNEDKSIDKTILNDLQKSQIEQNQQDITQIADVSQNNDISSFDIANNLSNAHYQKRKQYD